MSSGNRGVPRAKRPLSQGGEDEAAPGQPAGLSHQTEEAEALEPFRGASLGVALPGMVAVEADPRSRHESNMAPGSLKPPAAVMIATTLTCDE